MTRQTIAACVAIGAMLFVCSTHALEINDVYEVSVASGSQTISEAITGRSSIRKTGAGTLVLSGANTFTGGVSIEAGRVEVAATGALGSGTGVLRVAKGPVGFQIIFR